MFYWLKQKGKKQGDLLQIDKEPILELPLLNIVNSDQKEKSLHDKIIKLVDEMIKINKLPEKNKIKIEAKDREIDELVYDLYDITDDERKIVEGK